MSFNLQKYLSEGTKVKVALPMNVPEASTWDDDGGRISTRVKKLLQTRFFRGDRHLSAEVVYIAKESERERLRRQGLVKLRVRDPAGSILVLTADPTKLKTSN
jgi:hypothetical protein